MLNFERAEIGGRKKKHSSSIKEIEIRKPNDDIQSKETCTHEHARYFHSMVVLTIYRILIFFVAQNIEKNPTPKTTTDKSKRNNTTTATAAAPTNYNNKWKMRE